MGEDRRDSQARGIPPSWAASVVTPFDLESGLQAIMDHSSAAFFVKDTEGRYTMVNEAFLTPFALDRDLVIGRTSAEVWPDSDVSDEADSIVLEQGVVDTRDDVVELPDGPHTMMSVRFPLRDAEGRIDGLAAIVTDVTKRRATEEALEERNRLLDTILNASPDIVTVVDENGRVTAISRASWAILGYDLSKPVHEEVEELVHPDDRADAYEAYAQLLTREAESLDLRYRVKHRDGYWVTLDSRGQAIVREDGTVAGAVVISRDVTADLAFEEELERALATAQQASAAKSSFLSRMSHELRTPLNSVLGFAQLLELEELTPGQSEAVGHILRGGDHLLDLIDEVLDIARIESGHLHLSIEPVELLPLVREAVDLTRPLAETRSVRLGLDTTEIEEGTQVLADRQRLLQVLLNLLSNGVKYNDEGGSVVVSASRTDSIPSADYAPAVRVEVADDGPGIAPDAIGRVFDPFERLGAERGAVEGTGVGLTLSKHLIEVMNGSIDVKSEQGIGTTFSFVVPDALTKTPGPGRAGAAVDDSDAALTRSRDLPKLRGLLRVLHVEDNLANLELVEQVLSRAGSVELISATDGAGARVLARERRPDLVLMDLHLPDVGGDEVLAWLWDEPATSAIPVIVVSADAPALSTRPLPGNVVARIAKPIDVRELLRIVEDVLQPPGEHR